MYNTSEAYKQAIQSGYIKSRIELTIAPVNGQPITITDANILPGSLGINNRATSSGEFSYGSVYVGQFNVTLIDVEGAIDRYSLFNAQVTATFVQILSEIEEERISLGTYYVNNPTRKKKTIGLECYDAMTKFDVPLTEATFGTPYDLLAYLCAFVGVPLGMTQEEVNAMPNGNVQFTFAKYASMTARDALSNIAKVLCGFATIDRSGRLVIRRFGAESIDTISSGSRTSSTIADYQTFFVAVTASVTADGEEKSITALTGREDGLVLDLGNIPIAQGSATTMQAMVQTIADELAEVIYTPATCEIISNPAYDLGDMVQLTGVNNSQTNVLSVITAIDWKYHGKMKIVGDGRNALLNAVKSSEAKLIDNFANTVSENAYDVKVYTNASQIGLTSVAVPIITMNYSVYKNTTTVFLATIPLFMELDGEAIFCYHLNNEEVEEVKVYLEHGWHAVTLTNYFANESQSQNKLVVTCRTAYFESDKRVQDAQISGLIDAVETGEYVMGEIDTTIPSAYIPLTSIKSIIFASGLNTTESWDGTILMVDELGAVMLGASGITVKPIEDLPIVATNSNNTKPTITEQIPAITLGSSTLTVEQIVEAVSIGRKILFLTIDTSRANEYTYDRGKVAIIDDEFVLNQTYPFPSTRDTIDSGSMKKCDVDVSGITPSAMTVVASGENVSVEYKTLLADDTNVYNLGNEEIESVSAEIEYKQNLHGYDYPWVAGGGKNKSDAGAFETGVVNTDGTIVKGNTTINSQGNGEVEWTSTATWRGITSDYIPVKANTSYRISLTETPSYVLYAWYQADKTFISRASYNASNPVSITSPSNGAYVRFTLQESAIGSYDYHNIQFEEGSSATTYEPYENICPIEGHTSVDINVNGGNLFPYDELMDVSFYDATDDLLDIFNSLEAGNYEINMKAVITSVTGTGDWFCGLVAFNSGSTNVTAEEMMTATPYVGQEVDLSRTVYISPEHVGNFTRIEIYGCAFGSTNPKGTADISPFTLISEPDTYTMQFSVEGTNVFTRDNETDGKYLTSSGGYTNNANYAVSDYLEIEPQKRYVIEGASHGTATAVYHAWYDENETFIRSEQWNQEFIISPSNAKYLRVSYRTAGVPTSVHIEVGIVPHGIVDVATGVLTQDYAYISDLSKYNYSASMDVIYYTYPLSGAYSPATNPERLTGIASSGYRISLVQALNLTMTPYSMARANGRLYFRNDDYGGSTADFRQSMSGIQVVYELDEPCTYQLTPQEVKTLLGVNHVDSTIAKEISVTLTSGRVLTGRAVEFDSRATVVMQVGLLTNLDAEMFEDYGFDDLADMQDALTSIFSLGEFSILRWCNAVETASTMLATVTGVPGVQDIITPAFGITASHVTGIELTETDTSGSPWVAVKFDSGAWEYYDFTDEQWEEVGTGTLGHMTVADLEGLTEEIWAEKFTNASTMQTKLTLPTANDTIALVRYKFLQEEE